MPRFDLPPDVQERFFDFHWDHQKLLNVEAPTESVPVVGLLWLLDLPIWQRTPEQKIFDLSPAEVLTDPARFSDRMKRIQGADLQFPLILMKNLRDEWVIMDGYHRLAKAKLSDLPAILCRKLS